ncbi:TetR/AcrR family transcriptional regulator [Streptomyces odontomachi]|uniref:TetR/AcrR family transcriptional regulator n=1 Tax=Streptomyces odontomachi TaxID=2944940 RepID=UPI002108F7AB|nr:TetR/AcrR family transcriptional regulator [Streptomyces sp. ODS25]
MDAGRVERATGQPAVAGTTGEGGDGCPASGRRHTGRRRNEAARQAILDAALRLLAASDGTRVTVETIAREAGVGKQTLYRWWPSKGAVLLDALLDRADQDVPTPDTGRLRDDLREIIAATFQGAQSSPTGPALRTLVRESARDPHLAELMRTFVDARRVALRAVLERGAERGELPPERDRDLLVDQVYGVFWYRFLLGHAPLDDATAARLAESVLGYPA